MTRVIKVMGHSDEAWCGLVRFVKWTESETTVRMKLLERRRVHERVIDARRHVSGNCGVWYHRARELHRFFIAIARAIVNDHGLGGTIFDPCVWSVGSCQRGGGFVRVMRTMRRCLDLAVFRVGVGAVFRWRYKNRSHVLLYCRSKTMKL